MIRLMYFLLPLLHFVAASEEIHLFAVELENDTIHGVVDMDADANWMSHHIFAKQDSSYDAVTIARDHNKNIEVFKFDHINACLVRRIPKTVRAVWEFKAMLEIGEEHHFEGIPRVRLDEYLSCTTAQARLDQLGNVGYLCRHLKVYWLKQTKQMHSSGTGGKNKASSSSRQKRAANRWLDNLRLRVDDLDLRPRSALSVDTVSGVYSRRAGCGLCISCCKPSSSQRELGIEHLIVKRQVLEAKMCTRNVYVMNCPPK